LWLVPKAEPLVVGLTGGIGSGKSAAADAFAALGAVIVDTDQIAHALTGATGAAMPALRAAFGEQIAEASGALNRAAMRALAFTDPSAKATLEGILHPLIRDESARQVAAAKAQPHTPYVVLVVPLLVESGGYSRASGRVGRVCVVDCPEAVQIARVMARSGLPQEQVQAIMAAQASRAQRLAAADDVIDNSRDWASLQAQVSALDARYRALSRA
jgi:dephospho-CoA kinase